VKSQKTLVIQQIFDSLWDDRIETLSRTIVRLSDIAAAIQACRKKYGINLSSLNPANFIKDFLRTSSRNRNWPERLAQLRWTAVQTTGGGDAFEFIPYRPGQAEPFPAEFPLDEDARVLPVESLTLPIETREIARWDEARLIQVAVALRIVETYFAVVSSLRVEAIAHLQTNLKLSKSEIDALFIARLVGGSGKHITALVTCESKTGREQLNGSQIIAQIRAVATLGLAAEMIIPIAIRSSAGKIHVQEFAAVALAGVNSCESVQVIAEAAFELSPQIAGLTTKPGTRKSNS
jgi:hypothetical protein